MDMDVDVDVDMIWSGIVFQVTNIRQDAKQAAYQCLLDINFLLMSRYMLFLKASFLKQNLWQFSKISITDI